MQYSSSSVGLIFLLNLLESITWLVEKNILNIFNFTELHYITDFAEFLYVFCSSFQNNTFSCIASFPLATSILLNKELSNIAIEYKQQELSSISYVSLFSVRLRILS